MKIEFAKSLSGHDKDEIYFVRDTDRAYVNLVDGEKRTLAAPKKKNKRHIQIIKKLPIEVSGCFVSEVTDLTVRRAIRLYKKLCGGLTQK